MHRLAVGPFPKLRLAGYKGKWDRKEPSVSYKKSIPARNNGSMTETVSILEIHF
jgi:hypothetical protein